MRWSRLSRVEVLSIGNNWIECSGERNRWSGIWGLISDDLKSRLPDRNNVQ